MTAIPLIYKHRSKQPYKVSGSVALIGSSDLLADSKHGEQIDQYDNVFRFNLASTDPQFQAFTGSKTTCYLLSQQITTLRFPHPEPLQSRFMKICRQHDVICYPGHEKNVLKYNKRPYFLGVDVPTVNKIFHKLLKDENTLFPPNNHPRNGVKLLACLLNEGVQVDLFGFDLRDRGDNKHYFDDEKQIECDERGGHKPSLEYKLLTTLLEKGLIRSY